VAAGGRRKQQFDGAESGTTGYRLKQALNGNNQDPRFSDGSGPDESAGPLIVADEDGKPDYAAADWDSYGPSDLPNTLLGDVDGLKNRSRRIPRRRYGSVLQNNYPDINAGYYGAASDTGALDNPDDGTGPTTVKLRYTFELQRPNRGWAEYATDWAAKPPTRNSLLRFRASIRRTS